MKEAWKYRIKKFQKMMFLILKKNSCTLGLFLEITIERLITSTTIRMPIADRATPSRLWKKVLSVMVSR
jgi:hypothetical protein